MIIEYLNEKNVIREFCIREECAEKAIASLAKVKDEAIKLNASILYEKRLSAIAYFVIISFTDQVFMTAWECSIGNVSINDIVSSKVLISKDQNDDVAIDDRKEVEKLLSILKGQYYKKKK